MAASPGSLTATPWPVSCPSPSVGETPSSTLIPIYRRILSRPRRGFCAAWSRPALAPLARLAWVVFCLRRTRNFIRPHALPAPLTRGLLVECLCTGARPAEAFIWRQFFPSPGRHPLPGRAAGVLLSRLGSV